jgi:hypothetical protein
LRIAEVEMRTMTAQTNLKLMLSGALLSLLWSGAALAQGHGYVNYMRSSTSSYVFVQQSIDGEYGQHSTEGEAKDETGKTSSYEDKQYWKGYGIGTSVGLELMKFVQFVAGHTFVNLRHKDDALESLSGSRVHGGLRLVFTAPVANLELGSGLTGSRLDYQKQLENSSFYGSGFYYSVGLNYFMSSRISVYYEAKIVHEHLVRSGGSSSVSAMDTDATAMGLGFRIWL